MMRRGISVIVLSTADTRSLARACAPEDSREWQPLLPPDDPKAARCTSCIRAHVQLCGKRLFSGIKKKGINVGRHECCSVFLGETSPPLSLGKLHTVMCVFCVGNKNDNEFEFLFCTK